MSRRLRTAALGLAVAGVLAGAAIAHAASSTTSKPAPASSRPHSGYQMPAAQHHSGNCPNMGGSSGSGNSSDSSAPSAIGV